MKQQFDSNQRVVFMRDRGRVTIPAPLREKYDLEEGSELILAEEEGRLVLYPRKEERVEELLDQIGEALKERGITLEELLKESEQIRLEIFKESYPELAKKYDL